MSSLVVNNQTFNVQSIGQLDWLILYTRKT